jgi:uncharacterized membrane protein
MKTKFLLAGLAGGIFYFFLGWLVYGILLMDFYENNMIHYDGLNKEMPVMWMLALSNLLMGYFLAFVFDRWAAISTLKSGFTGGLIIGFFITIIYDLSFLSMMNLMNPTMVAADIVVSSLVIGLVGAVVGWVLGYTKKA